MVLVPYPAGHRHQTYWRFHLHNPGTRSDMQDEDELSTETPAADALEQQQSTAVPLADDEAPRTDDSPPLESDPPDWQEQQEVVDLDPELDDRG